MTAPLDPEEFAILRAIYRTRSSTVESLAAHRALPTSRVREVLDELHAAGFVVIDGDLIRPTAPDAAIASVAARAIEQQRTASQELSGLLGQLPLLSREWETGEAGSDYPLSAEVIHGHRAQWEAWARYAAAFPPRNPINLYPSLDVVRDMMVPELDVVRPSVETGARFRAIVPSSVAADPEDQPILEALRNVGSVEIRTLPSVPSWIYVDEGLLAGIPLIWGEYPPTSLLIVRSEAIVAALSAMVEAEWNRATPYPHTTASWSDVLELLAAGHSDTAIAHLLGTSLRTVQRRITEAMAELRVGSRFELGVAWARR